MKTRLSPWQMPGIKTGENAMKYVQVKHTTVAHVRNESITYKVPFPEKIEGILIQTIRIRSHQNIAFIADLLDGPTGYSLYGSLDELQLLYDQVSIPYLPDEKAIYIRILNKGDVTTKFDIDIRGVEVK